jgi:aarF domain-containing kinase
MRRMGYLTAAAAVGTAAFDVTNDYVVSRSVRTLVNAVRIGHLYKTTDPETAEELSNLHRAAAQIILDTCLSNEGLYIKLGQGLHAINHILPEEYLETLRVLLDKAPVVPLEAVRKIFMKETGSSRFEDVFVSFQEEPVASASIAQVHKATMRRPDGEVVEVAVKIQKPNIQKQIWWDLQCYFLVCKMLQYAFDLPMMWSAQCIADNLTKEIDFLSEADNSDRARELLRHRSDIHIPAVYREVLTPRLIVSEWVDAVKLVDVHAVQKTYKSADVMNSVLSAFGEMIFEHGFVHCDPHPANLMIRRNQNPRNKKPFEVVIIDFGLCVAESNKFRLEYSLLFKTIFQGDRDLLKQIVISWGIGNADLFASLTIQKPFTTKSMRAGTVTKSDIAQMEHQMKDHVKNLLAREELVPQELVFVGRSMNLLRSVNKSFGAPVNRINIMAGCAVRALGHLTTLEDIQDVLQGLDAATVEHRHRKRDSVRGAMLEFHFHATLAWLALIHVATKWYNLFVYFILPVAWSDVLSVGNLEEQLEMKEKQMVRAAKDHSVKGQLQHIDKMQKFHQPMRIGAND